MIDLEVRGALNVVEACSNAAVKRLVLTSSLSAMVWDQQRNAGTEGAYNSCIDEKCWSNLDFCRAKKVRLLSTATASHLPKCVCVCVCVALSLSSPPSPASGSTRTASARTSPAYWIFGSSVSGRRALWGERLWILSNLIVLQIVCGRTVFTAAMGSCGEDHDRESGLGLSKRQRAGHGGHQPCHCTGSQTHDQLLHSIYHDLPERYPFVTYLRTCTPVVLSILIFPEIWIARVFLFFLFSCEAGGCDFSFFWHFSTIGSWQEV